MLQRPWQPSQAIPCVPLPLLPYCTCNALYVLTQNEAEGDQERPLIHVARHVVLLLFPERVQSSWLHAA